MESQLLKDIQKLIHELEHLHRVHTPTRSSFELPDKAETCIAAAVKQACTAAHRFRAEQKSHLVAKRTGSTHRESRGVIRCGLALSAFAMLIVN
jgi:hypothetical protein